MSTNAITTQFEYEQKVSRISRFLSTLFERGDLIELRTLAAPDGKIRRILTADVHVAARCAVLMEKQDCDVYYCVNPADPDRWYAKNTLRDFYNTCQYGAWRTLQDEDVKIRNTFFIDIDARRPDTKVAATPEQVAATLVAAKAIQNYLCIELGWEEPIVVGSGNGHHLLFKSERYAVKGESWPRALGFLAKTFSNPDADIDIKVCNPSRLARMPYCLNKKSQRFATVLSYPVMLKPTGYGTMWSLSEKGEAAAQYSGDRTTSALLHEDFDVEDFIEAFPDQFGDLLNVTPDGDLTYYSTEICPIKGAPHSNQPGNGHNCLIVGGPSGLGFQCFGCEGTIGDVLRLLREQTGHGYDRPIWADDDLDHSDQWWDSQAKVWVDFDWDELGKRFPVELADGGIPVWLYAGIATAVIGDDGEFVEPKAVDEEVVEEVEAEEIVAEEKVEEEAVEEVIPEPVTAHIHSAHVTAIFKYCANYADGLIARVNPAGQAAFRKEIERILRANDRKRIFELLGTSMITELYTNFLTSPEPLDFETDFMLTGTIEFHGHEMAIAAKAFTEAKWQASISGESAPLKAEMGYGDHHDRRSQAHPTR